MRRRRLLAYGGVAAVAAGGGWYFFLRETSPGGPEGVVYEVANATENGDEEALQQLIHEDSPNQESLMSELETGVSGELSVDVRETEVTNRETGVGQPDVQEFATVNATIAFTFELGGDSQMQEAETQTQEGSSEFVVAQNSEGDWKLWGTN